MKQLALWAMVYGDPNAQPVDRVDVMFFSGGTINPWLADQIGDRVSDEVYDQVWRNSPFRRPDHQAIMQAAAEAAAKHRNPRRIWSFLRKYLPKRRKPIAVPIIFVPISKIGLYIGQRHNGVHLGQKCIKDLGRPLKDFL